MRYKWIIPLTILLLLLLAWGLRYETLATKSIENEIMKWKRDRWTGLISTEKYSKDGYRRQFDLGPINTDELRHKFALDLYNTNYETLMQTVNQEWKYFTPPIGWDEKIESTYKKLDYIEEKITKELLVKEQQLKAKENLFTYVGMLTIGTTFVWLLLAFRKDMKHKAASGLY